jgi:two-component system, sensor histidine kinase and response regulator
MNAERDVKGKILVVEDDIYLMEGIRDILELDGYEVVTADSGKSGLDVLRRSYPLPDLIVSDIMMPVMDGYEFLNAVRSETNWIDLPFIFLTAKGERSDQNLGKELGADDYVTKPFGPEDLLVAVSAKLKRRRLQRQKYEQEVADTKRKIMTILYHEFNTPITYVVAYNDMLQQTDPDALNTDTMRTFLQGIDSGASRLRRLIENFIVLVELQTDEAEESYVLHRGLIEDYQLLLKPLRFEAEQEAERENQEFVLVINPDLPPMMGYAEYMRKGIRCLIDNAQKFSEAGTTVKLHVFHDEARDMIVFAVHDEGRGIPEDERSRIFDLFYQINRKQYEDQGAGAGLTIAKRIVEMHGGTITLDSEVDNGSIFYLYFPAEID